MKQLLSSFILPTPPLKDSCVVLHLNVKASRKSFPLVMFLLLSRWFAWKTFIWRKRWVVAKIFWLERENWRTFKILCAIKPVTAERINCYRIVVFKGPYFRSSSFSNPYSYSTFMERTVTQTTGFYYVLQIVFARIYWIISC